MNPLGDLSEWTEMAGGGSVVVFIDEAHDKPDRVWISTDGIFDRDDDPPLVGLTPVEARLMASRLLALADEVEGKA